MWWGWDAWDGSALKQGQTSGINTETLTDQIDKEPPDLV